MYEKITKRVYPEYPHQRAFLCETELEQIWSEEDIMCVLGYSSNQHEDIRFIKDNLLRTLSTLVLIDVPDLEPVLDLLCPRTSRYQRSHQFPFPKELLNDRLESHHRDLFYEKQYIFCPIVIERQQKAGIIYEDSMHPFPFMETESTTAVVVAYKVVSNRDDFRQEVENLDLLKESLTAHKHIVVHLTAIVHGSNFHIFLPYTELGSLEIFLCEGIDESLGTDYEKMTYQFGTYFPADSLQPLHMLRQMLNLCGALDFLHDRLQIGQSQIYCAHMDLRPQNVLVFGPSASEPLGIWKISDFGISSFKKFRNTKEQTYLSIRDFADMHSSIPTDRNLEGAHRSPENHGSHKGSYSGRKSDMWSYACILVEVLTFALGARDLLSEFRKLKAQEDQYDSDAFFTTEQTLSVDETNEYSVKLRVVEWLDELSERFLEDRKWIDSVVKIILATLKIVPEERLRARQVCTKLEHVLEHHFQPSDENKAPLPSAAPEIEGLPVHPNKKHRIGVWRFDLPRSSSTVKDWSLSPFGDRAAFLLKHRKYSIYIFSTSGEDGNSATTIVEDLPTGVEWKTLRLGLLVIEAMPEVPKRRLLHTEKQFKQRQIALVATNDFLVYIDVELNVCYWPLSRNAGGFLELQGDGTSLGRCRKFSGKPRLAAQIDTDNTVLVSVCTKYGDFQAQQYTLPAST
ncbi:hypothetical protein Q9189_005329 [Teloschistes chrysophthalmus]